MNQFGDLNQWVLLRGRFGARACLGTPQRTRAMKWKKSTSRRARLPVHCQCWASDGRY